MSKIVNPNVTDDNRKLVDYYLGNLSEIKIIKTHFDEDETSSVCIFHAKNSPEIGFQTYATIGVSDCIIYISDEALDQRVELISSSLEDGQIVSNILATAAFGVLKDSWEVYPGAIFSDLYSMYLPNSCLKHAFFIDPFLWSNISGVSFSTKYITFLQMVGVTEAEYQYMKAHGPERLLSVFEEMNVDVFDLDRSSCV